MHTFTASGICPKLNAKTINVSSNDTYNHANPPNELLPIDFLLASELS
jgi:hypothetical protein